MPPERQKEIRRAAMLESAARLFSQKGYARTTFEQIAAASGFGVAAVYRVSQINRPRDESLGVL
ncbi:MAG: helix-turn-helix domain-containing protein [Steroidobacteraceae bacterium]